MTEGTQLEVAEPAGNPDFRLPSSPEDRGKRKSGEREGRKEWGE